MQITYDFVDQTAFEIASETENGAEWLLRSGIKNQLRCDAAETVQNIASYVMSQYRVLGVGSRFMERQRQTRIPAVAAFLGALTRFLEPRLIEHFDFETAAATNANAIYVARLENERRVLRNLPALVPELRWTELRFFRTPERAVVRTAQQRLLPHRRRIQKIVRTLLRTRHDFFKILRAAELIGYYARYLEVFERGDYKLAVMSSHSNPHGIAFNLAARKCRVPIVLITHGMPVRPVARLGFDLAVVHCEAARQTYLAEGVRMKRVIVHGRKQDYQPMPARVSADNLTVGIFLCKDVNKQRVQWLTAQLLKDQRVAQVLIRPHPKNLWLGLNKWIETLGEPRVRLSQNDAAASDLKNVDVVLAGNSSVLVEAVTAGRPSAYVSGLDFASPDLHEFVKQKLIYPFDETFDSSRMLEFYQRTDWTATLKLFADVTKDETASAAEIAAAFRAELAAASKKFDR